MTESLVAKCETTMLVVRSQCLITEVEWSVDEAKCEYAKTADDSLDFSANEQ